MMARLAAEHSEKKGVMIDTTYLKANRTETGVAAKKGGWLHPLTLIVRKIAARL